MAKIFLGIPHYGQIVHEAIPGIILSAQQHGVILRFEGGSLLTLNFNRLWATGLNLRGPDGPSHWAMMHSDIAPGPGWLDILYSEMEAHQADIMSAVIPIKNNMGLTSTATVDLLTGKSCRLTMKDLKSLPPTFGKEDLPAGKFLAINTGLWMCRFTEDWVEKVCFHVKDEIIREDDGSWEAYILSEDWNFSAFCEQYHLKVMATTRVPVNHIGATSYSNQSSWGTVETEGALDPSTTLQHPASQQMLFPFVDSCKAV